MPHTPYPSSYYAASANPAPPRPGVPGGAARDWPTRRNRRRG
ncbi:hypothetical protein, partial [Pseudomonas aeruginosa]